jgi:hypothetical protein
MKKELINIAKQIEKIQQINHNNIAKIYEILSKSDNELIFAAEYC